MRDLRYAFRSLARTPVFAVTAVVILSLSVGAATTVFTLLYALALRPLPIANAHELARVMTVDRRGSEADLPWRLYREFAANQQIFSVIIPTLDQSVLTFDTDRGTERGALAGVAGNFYHEFGATPVLGRLIQPADVNMSTATGAPVAVLGFNFWQRHFGADPNVVGQRIKADGVPLTIIGVAPKDFLGFSISIEHDLTVPIPLLPSIMASEATMLHGTSRWISTIGRLAPGVTLASAHAQVEAMWPSLLDAAMPEQFLTTQREDYLKWTPRVASAASGIERGLRSRYTNPLYALLGIATLVLVIAAANLCALVFARTESRRQELAVRLALGAGRRRVVGGLGVEGALLGIAGAGGGIVFAAFASDAIIRFLVRDYTIRTSLNTSPDTTVMAIAMLSSAGVAIAVTVAAAMAATRHGGLTPGASRTVARSSRTGRVLVGAQIAAAIIMLAHASLLVRSVYAITAVDTGLTAETVILGYPSPRLNAYQKLDAATYYQQALERVMAVPGVASAAFSTFKPQAGAGPLEYVGRGNTPRAATDLQAEWPTVSPGFFRTLGIPILRGRDFTYADGEKGQKVQDVRSNNRAIVYTAAVQSGAAAHYKCLIARAPASAVPELQRTIESLGVELMPRTQTLAYARGRAILQERLLAGLSGYFAALALILVSAGIYGLLSYVLSLRRKEIGIRMALGADAARMTRSILRDGLMVTSIGIAIGLAGVVFSVPLIRRLLVNTSPYDPIAIGMAGVLLLVITSAASVVPAMRAGRVEPLAELRRD